MADDVRVPAGWYPDPLGLPQLRWWDNHAWTEHTSDAEVPDDGTRPSAPGTSPIPLPPGELPSRRAMRERERLAAGETADSDSPAGPAAFADPRRPLETPPAESGQEPSDREHSVAVHYAMAGLLDDAPRTPRYELDERHDDLLAGPTPRSAITHVGDTMASRGPADPRRSLAGTRARTGTGPVWALALLPIAMLITGMLVLLSGPRASFWPITLGLVFGVPWLAGIGLAVADSVLLRRAGMDRPASWLWSLAGPPVYLIARLVGTVRETGSGFGPLVTSAAVALVGVATIVAVPGLAMILSPAAFAAEAESSVADDALSFGVALSVECPDTPPMLMHQSFSCRATDEDGRAFPVVVTLERSNGWIDWRVDDWGALAPD